MNPNFPNKNADILTMYIARNYTKYQLMEFTTRQQFRSGREYTVYKQVCVRQPFGAWAGVRQGIYIPQIAVSQYMYTLRALAKKFGISTRCLYGQQT